MRAITIAFALLALPGLSAADVFDDALAKSDEVGVRDMGALLWSQSGVCPDARDKGDRVACREVAARLREQNAGRSFHLRRTSNVLTAGRYNRKRKSLPVVAEACLHCDPVSSGNESLLVIGRAPGVKVIAPLRTSSMVFDSRDDAKAWEKESLPRLVGQYLFRVPATADRVTYQGKRAAFIDVLSYRIYDPCTGAIAVSKPKKMRAVSPNASACK